jgi:inosine-uridine nucleoside N-ribohydrolase
MGSRPVTDDPKVLYFELHAAKRVMMKPCKRGLFPVVLLLLASTFCGAQQRRKVIIDQDAAGPGGSGQQSILLLVQSPQAEVLGITVVTGDQWRDEEVAHTLRTLEIIGRTDIPVVPGAEYPLVRRKADTELWERRYGSVEWLGAWTPRLWHEPGVVPALPEGRPATKPAAEDAAHFLVRMVHQYPHQVTIYEGGPMTDLALAILIDPQFPSLAQELVFMGGSLNPQTEDPEFANNPRREFNLWFDPEAAHIVLRAPWHKITCTPVDISLKTDLSPERMQTLAASGTVIGRYLAAHYRTDYPNYMWDELAAAAWLEPSIITGEKSKYMDVDLDRGAGDGDTLTWAERNKPTLDLQPVHIQVDLNLENFYRIFLRLMTSPTPRP